MVLEELERKGWLNSEEARFKQQTLTRQFQSRYLNKLVTDWDFVELEGKTRARYIKLNKKGKMYLRMFEYLIED